MHMMFSASLLFMSASCFLCSVEIGCDYAAFGFKPGCLKDQVGECAFPAVTVVGAQPGLSGWFALKAALFRVVWLLVLQKQKWLWCPQRENHTSFPVGDCSGQQTWHGPFKYHGLVVPKALHWPLLKMFFRPFMAVVEHFLAFSRIVHSSSVPSKKTGYLRSNFVWIYAVGNYIWHFMFLLQKLPVAIINNSRD